jgi:hypothetical protein
MPFNTVNAIEPKAAIYHRIRELTGRQVKMGQLSDDPTPSVTETPHNRLQISGRTGDLRVT